MADEITPAKLAALQQELDAHGKVRFKNGAVIESIERYRLTTPLGAVVVYTQEELRKAYEVALRGPAPLPQPATEEELDARYGTKAPF